MVDLLAAISERDCGKGSSVKESLKLKEADLLERLYIFIIYLIRLNPCCRGLCAGQNSHGKVSKKGMNLCSASVLILNLVTCEN